MEILNIDYAKMMVEDHSDDNKVAVLFIAGASGGVFTDKFDKLKDKILEKGYSYVPIEIWKDANDLDKVTIQNIFSSIDNAVSKLKDLGYNTFFAVGKSFGGGMLLARNHPAFSKLVLWAPVIGFGEKSTIDTLHNVPLGKIESIFNIMLSNNDLSRINAKVTILYGSEDQIISESKTKELLELLSHGYLEIIQGLGHSAKNEEQETILVKNTLDALCN